MGKNTSNQDKERPLGTRVGKLLNKLAKLDDQEAAELAKAPEAIKLKYAKRRGKAKQEAENDVLAKLGIDYMKDEDCKAYVAE